VQRQPDQAGNRERAWEIRLQQDNRIWFAVPGSKHYTGRSFTNTPGSFANLSITGNACALRCEHCQARLLQAMLPAETPEKMSAAVDRLMERGCRGILVSGGADRQGEVPLVGFAPALRYAHERGLAVLVHTGLIEKETARMLKDCGVDQVLMDVIGHSDTIRDVCHLERTPADYLRSLLICREVGLDCAPHVVIGLHFGRILGEYEALRMIRQAQPRTVVLVVLVPAAGTGMATVSPPALCAVEEVLCAARIENPESFLSLGCAKPAGEYKRRVEIAAIECGFNAIAFPSEAAVDHARTRGMVPVFTEQCCSMAGSERAGRIAG
jgi:uncharacterized radical SAM superfamily protein